MLHQAAPLELLQHPDVGERLVDRGGAEMRFVVRRQGGEVGTANGEGDVGAALSLHGGGGLQPRPRRFELRVAAAAVEQGRLEHDAGGRAAAVGDRLVVAARTAVLRLAEQARQVGAARRAQALLRRVELGSRRARRRRARQRQAHALVHRQRIRPRDGGQKREQADEQGRTVLACHSLVIQGALRIRENHLAALP